MKTILILLAFSSAPVFAVPVQFNVENVRSTTGSIQISLFTQPADWDREVASQILEIRPLTGATATLTVDLPEGEYAFFLYDDVNDNGQLERSIFRMPQEPYAFSNNVVPRLSKPSWDDMKFVVGADGATQTVQLIDP